jgi:hypothetical protein
LSKARVGFHILSGTTTTNAGLNSHQKEGNNHMQAHKVFLRFVLVAAMSWGLGPGRAETQTLAPTQAQAGTNKVKGPPKGCKAGVMRCISNEMRRAAAVRNADRRAKHLREKGAGK